MRRFEAKGINMFETLFDSHCEDSTASRTKRGTLNHSKERHRRSRGIFLKFVTSLRRASGKYRGKRGKSKLIAMLDSLDSLADQLLNCLKWRRVQMVPLHEIFWSVVT